MAFETFRKITFTDMKDYIEKNHPEDKAWFKSVAIDPNGKYQHLVAVRAFCQKYMPDKLPVAKPKKENITSVLSNW